MDSERLQALVHEWYDALFRFAYSLCGDPDDARDLTQSAFQKLAVHAKSLREPSKAKSWLFSTLHREFIDQYRRRRRFPHTTLEKAPEPQQSGGSNPGIRIDAESMMRALAILEEKFRAPLVLFYLESLSYRDIADVLAIPIGTVMSRLRRAKDQLRARLEEGCGDASEPIDFRKEAHHG